MHKIMGLLAALVLVGCTDNSAGRTTSLEADPNAVEPEATPEATPDPLPEPQPEPEAQPEANPTPEPPAEPEAVEPEATPEPQPEPQPDPQPEPQPEAQPEAQPEGEPEAEPEPPFTRDPPAPPTYSLGECPELVGGPTSDTSVIAQFPTGDQVRRLRLLVPDRYDGTEPWPLVFAWHWLNASSGSFVREAQMESAVDQMGFIAVLPDGLENDNGDRAYLFDWPFAEVWGVEAELQFFDDMLACVTEQFNVDLRRIYGIGVSAGALWLTHLSTTDRVDHFAAVESLSGGLGEVLGVWEMAWTPQPHKFPALVLWGGVIDWLGLSFHEASLRYRDALIDDGHFVVTCTHDAGHAVPPIEAPAETQTRFLALWSFMLDHPYGTPPGHSPYFQTGLPDFFPDWCEIASPEP